MFTELVVVLMFILLIAASIAGVVMLVDHLNRKKVDYLAYTLTHDVYPEICKSTKKLTMDMLNDVMEKTKEIMEDM